MSTGQVVTRSPALKRCRIEMLGFRRMFFGVAADLIAALVAFAAVAVLFRKESYASSAMGFEASLHRFDPCLIFLAFPLFTLFLGFGRCDFCLFHPFRFRESIHSAIPLSTTSPPGLIRDTSPIWAISVSRVSVNCCQQGSMREGFVRFLGYV